MWELRYTNQAKKDAKKLASSGLKGKAQELLEIVSHNPYAELANFSSSHSFGDSPRPQTGE